LRERRDDIAKLLHYVFYGHIYSSSYSTQKPLQAAGNLTQEIKKYFINKLYESGDRDFHKELHTGIVLDKSQK
jgi:hypothetical protein